MRLSCYRPGELIGSAALSSTRNGKGLILEAIKISASQRNSSLNDASHFHDVTYYVVKTPSLGERRSSRRRRTRLRSGKIVNPRSAYLVDCQIYDRSGMGARVRLFDNVALPGKIQLFEDVSESLITATIVWRRNREIGICFGHCAQRRHLTAVQLTRLRAGYNPAKARFASIISFTPLY